MSGPSVTRPALLVSTYVSIDASAMGSNCGVLSCSYRLYDAAIGSATPGASRTRQAARIRQQPAALSALPLSDTWVPQLTGDLLRTRHRQCWSADHGRVNTRKSLVTRPAASAASSCVNCRMHWSHAVSPPGSVEGQIGSAAGRDLRRRNWAVMLLALDRDRPRSILPRPRRSTSSLTGQNARA
jgi:hypothetical protein